MTNIAIHGAAGRMGKRLIALTSADDNLKLTGAIENSNNAQLGKDAGETAGIGTLNVPISDKLDGDVDVVIDFSLPAATQNLLKLCTGKGAALVIGTTGQDEESQALIDQAAAQIAILQAPNMSLGVNLLFSLAAQAAKTLGDDYDIEIIEAHHRFKKDAPSGTALGIAKAVCNATGKDLDKVVKHGRNGQDEREKGQIGMHALRLGDEVGRHTICFGTLGEEIQISHKASNRDVFAQGALRAAKWLAGKPAGKYQIKDMLELD